MSPEKAKGQSELALGAPSRKLKFFSYTALAYRLGRRASIWPVRNTDYGNYEREWALGGWVGIFLESFLSFAFFLVLVSGP